MKTFFFFLVFAPEFVEFCDENLCFLVFNRKFVKIRAFFELKFFFYFTLEIVEFRDEDLCFLTSPKSFCPPQKFVYAPQSRYPGTGAVDSQRGLFKLFTTTQIFA